MIIWLLGASCGIQFYTSSERCQVEPGRAAYHCHIVFWRGNAETLSRCVCEIMRTDPGNIWKLKSSYWNTARAISVHIIIKSDVIFSPLHRTRYVQRSVLTADAIEIKFLAFFFHFIFLYLESERTSTHRYNSNAFHFSLFNFSSTTLWALSWLLYSLGLLHEMK